MNLTPAQGTRRQTVLSTLWIFVVLNYLYADIVLLIVKPAASQTAAARMTGGVVLGFAVLMEISLVMVLLSRVLPYRANRWANIVAGAESTGFVAFPLFGGAPPPYYIFFSTIEIACTLFIVWYAWTWRRPEGPP
jgi:uncharacterized BrkB/YihY/UPF0761 family membrane protein